jgi:hypothetical protein
MTLMEKCHFTFASCVSLGSFPQCVGDRILNTICRSRTMDLGLHIAVHARKKSFLRHTVRVVTISGHPGRQANSTPITAIPGIGIVSPYAPLCPLRFLAAVLTNK